MICKNKIERKTMLYVTGVEYGDYTLNHVLGCSHGCKYPCYAMMMKRRFGAIKDYDDWCNPRLVSNTLEILDKELPKLKVKIKSVHLCFTTDPFMFQYTDISNMSIEIIKKINLYDIPCTALTKGVLPKDLSKLSKENSYGITLISLDESYREEYEPGSAPYYERIKSLKYLHDKGCNTWVSIEPYPTPNILEQGFKEILEAISFVDKIIFGRLNYNKKVTAYSGYQKFYNDLCNEIIQFCNSNKISYHIKEGTYKET